ncbi:MAG: hypothetical protein ACYC1I_05295 [Acidimicrobiales bacterium]
MYRKSKFRLVPRIGGNALIALIALGSGVAVTNAVSHQSHVTTTSTPGTRAASGSVTTTAGAVTTSQPQSSTSATLISAPTPHVSAVAGVVTTLSSSSVSIRSRSGTTLTYGLNSSTIVMRGRTRTTLASVKVATSVYVVPSTSSPTTAAAIGIIPATIGAEPSEGGSNGSDGN